MEALSGGHSATPAVTDYSRRRWPSIRRRLHESMRCSPAWAFLTRISRRRTWKQTSKTRYDSGNNQGGILKNRHVWLGAPWLGVVVMIALMLFGAAAPPLNAQSKDFTPSIFDLDPFGGYQFYHGGRIQSMQDGVLGGMRVTWDFH